MRLGIYRHYKGNLYLVKAIARHTETLESLVCYQSLYGDFGNWVRPQTMFEGKIIDEVEDELHMVLEVPMPILTNLYLFGFKRSFLFCNITKNCIWKYRHRIVYDI